MAGPGANQWRRRRDPVWRCSVDALLLADAASGAILDANPRAEVLFGRPHAELCAYRLADLLPARVLPGVDGAAAPTLAEEDLTRPDGTRVAVEIQCSRFIENGRPELLVDLRDIGERRRAAADIQRLAWSLEAIMRANMAAVTAPSESAVMQAVADGITSSSIFPLAWIGLARDDPGKSVDIVARSGPAAAYLQDLALSWAEDTPVGRGPTGMAVRSATTQVNTDATRNPNFRPWAERARRFGIGSSLSVPLCEEGRSFGVLSVYADRPDAFAEAELRLFEELARHLVFAIRARRTDCAYQAALAERQCQGQRMRQCLEQMVATLSATIEKRDPYTAGHERRVATLAEAIARECGLDEEHCRTVRLAGLVHDVGKIQVPAEILNKPGPLTAIEYALIKSHPAVSRELLQGVDFPWALADIAGQHHERLDGSGYPDGLAGERILPEARILAVADILEAVSSHRPYRPALGLAFGLQEIARLRGTQLDPDAVDAATRLLKGGFTF